MRLTKDMKTEIVDALLAHKFKPLVEGLSKQVAAFAINAHAAKKIKKLCAYHNSKADRYEALAKHYAVKAQQHRTAANAYMSGASTIALETADLTVFAANVKPSDLSKRIEAAQARNSDPEAWRLAC